MAATTYGVFCLGDDGLYTRATRKVFASVVEAWHYASRIAPSRLAIVQALGRVA